jgi:hypothetical protein
LVLAFIDLFSYENSVLYILCLFRHTLQRIFCLEIGSKADIFINGLRE